MKTYDVIIEDRRISFEIKEETVEAIARINGIYGFELGEILDAMFAHVDEYSLCVERPFPKEAGDIPRKDTLTGWLLSSNSRLYDADNLADLFNEIEYNKDEYFQVGATPEHKANCLKCIKDKRLEILKIREEYEICMGQQLTYEQWSQELDTFRYWYNEWYKPHCPITLDIFDDIVD
jgi:hypothetical protein